MVNIREGTVLHHSGNGDIFKVLITTSSIILFSLEEGDSSQKKEESNFNHLLIGYGLLFTSLLFDGIIAIKEKDINHEVHNNPEFADYKRVLSWEYMHCFSLYTFIFSIFGIVYTFLFTNLGDEYMIFLSLPHFPTNILLGTLFGSLGQIFIFQILDKYGPLTLSIITGVRKILSIVLSIIIFNKSIGTIKLFSLILGGSVICWEVLEKSIKPKHAVCENIKKDE